MGIVHTFGMEECGAVTNSTSRNQENTGSVEDVCRDFLRNVVRIRVICLFTLSATKFNA